MQPVEPSHPRVDAWGRRVTVAGARGPAPHDAPPRDVLAELGGVAITAGMVLTLTVLLLARL